MLQPVLLAEDNEHDAVFFQHQLVAARILNPVQIVTDGEQVIAYLDGQGQYADRALYPLPIILFLDLRMPRIDGYQILAFLRASALYRTLPVVVLSVVGELKYLGEAYQRGANSFLIKPLAASDLLETLRAIPSLVLKPEQDGLSIRPTGWTELPTGLPTFIRPTGWTELPTGLPTFIPPPGASDGASPSPT